MKIKVDAEIAELKHKVAEKDAEIARLTEQLMWFFKNEGGN